MPSSTRKKKTPPTSKKKQPTRAKAASVDRRFDKMDAKIDRVEKHLETKIDAVEKRLEAKIDRVDMRIDAVERRLFGVEKSLFKMDAKIDSKIDGVKADLIRGMNSQITHALGVIEERFNELFGLLDDKFSAKANELRADLDEHRFDTAIHLGGGRPSRASEPKTGYKPSAKSRRVPPGKIRGRRSRGRTKRR